jgi:hypothetical protein
MSPVAMTPPLDSADGHEGSDPFGWFRVDNQLRGDRPRGLGAPLGWWDT